MAGELAGPRCDVSVDAGRASSAVSRLAVLCIVCILGFFCGFVFGFASGITAVAP